MAKYKIEIEQDETEMSMTSIAKTMLEKSLKMKLTFRDFFNLIVMNSIANPPRAARTLTKKQSQRK